MRQSHGEWFPWMLPRPQLLEAYTTICICFSARLASLGPKLESGDSHLGSVINGLCDLEAVI